MTHTKRSDRSRAGEPHVLDRIPAFLDGELSDADRERVRSHLRDCAACAAALAESERLQGFLREDSAALDEAWARLPSLWPGVRARALAPARPRFGFLMTLSASTAAVAGLLIGALLVPRGNDDSALIASQAVTGGDWDEVGSLIAGGAGTSLDEIYLADAEEGEEQP